jgi:hypothetical protein
MVMRLALLIGGEAMMSLDVKAVCHIGCTLAAHNYGNVMDVSHFGKHRDRLPIQGSSEAKMRRESAVDSGCCVTVRRSHGQVSEAGHKEV